MRCSGCRRAITGEPGPCAFAGGDKAYRSEIRFAHALKRGENLDRIIQTECAGLLVVSESLAIARP